MEFTPVLVITTHHTAFSIRVLPLFDMFDLPVYTATLGNRDSNAKFGSYLDDHDFFTVRREIIDLPLRKCIIAAFFIGEIVFLLLQIQVT